MKRPWSVLALLFLVTGAGPAGADEAAVWPQWSGPLRNGGSPATGVFGGGPVQLREVWRRPAPGGISSLAVAAGRVFSLGSEEGKDFAFALEAGTGKELWRVTLGDSVARMAEYGVASTPATDGERVFVVSADCKLLALEAGSGKTVWQRDFTAEDNTGPVPRGCWTSPLLAGDLLIVQVNGDPDKRVMAFDKTSGKVVWAAAGTVKSWRTSPLLVELGGARQVVVHEADEGRGGFYGLRLDDGRLLWSVRFEGSESYSYDTPIPMAGDRLGVVAWSDFRSARVLREGEVFRAEPAWTSRDLRAEVQPYNLHAVSHGDHVYGFGGDFLACLEAATGRTVWKEKIYPGSLIVVDGHLVVLSVAAGLLRVVEATPAGYREKARLEVFNPGAPTDTPPAFAGRRIYLRNSEDIMAVDVVAGNPESTGAAGAEQAKPRQ